MEATSSKSRGKCPYYGKKGQDIGWQASTSSGESVRSAGRRGVLKTELPTTDFFSFAGPIRMPLVAGSVAVNLLIG
jgi:hypothetical protein